MIEKIVPKISYKFLILSIIRIKYALLVVNFLILSIHVYELKLIKCLFYLLDS